MTGEDLRVAFEDVPAAWRTRLTGWAPQAIERVIEGVRAASGGRPIAPADPWRALRLVAPEQARVVILGQDPYPTAGHADGLAFSSAGGRPPSLRRIFAVLAQNRPGFVAPGHARLDAWANQGVLLLNTVLTVEVGRIGSHLACGWQELTGEIIRVLLRRADPPVFMLWGTRAKAFFEEAAAGLDVAMPEGLEVLTTRHPSNDFRREFMSQASHFLATAHQVDWWQLDDPSPSA
jgi:uracil-DNA glycosylase